MEGRYCYGMRVFELLAGRFDTVASVIDRVKRIMVAYGFI